MKDTTGGQLQKDLESIDRFHKDKCPRCLNKDCNCTYKGEEKAATERIREIEEKKYKDVTGGDGYGATVNAICVYLDEISTPHTEKEEKKLCVHNGGCLDKSGIHCPEWESNYSPLSPLDKTWSEVDEVTETIRNGKYVEAHIVKELITSATIKAKEIGYQEGFDKGYETASGERHWE